MHATLANLLTVRSYLRVLVVHNNFLVGSAVFLTKSNALRAVKFEKSSKICTIPAHSVVRQANQIV